MSRAVGYAPWSPKNASLALVDSVNAVLDEYGDYLPLTGRQVFYRLVGAHGYAKTERDYKNLLEKINRGRRAGLIDWFAIRDDGVTTSGGGGHATGEEVVRMWMNDAEGFSLDRMSLQPIHVEVWVEAAGMVPQIVRATQHWMPTVYSSGGFNSTTMKRESAIRIMRRWARTGQPTVVLHVGDHDPSGVSIFDNLNHDLHAFLIGDGAPWDALTMERVAVTDQQAMELDLESAPPKSTDSRSARWTGGTYQAEAIPPGTLADIVEGAVSDHMDPDVHEATIAEEFRISRLLVEALDGVEL